MKKIISLVVIFVCIVVVGIFVFFSKNKYEKDMEYFIDTIKNNYPYHEQLDIDKDKYMNMAKKCKNNEEFYNLLDTVVEPYSGLGHLYILDAEEYYSHLVIYKDASNQGQIFKDNKNLKILLSEEVRESYDGLSNLSGITYKMVEDSYNDTKGGLSKSNVSFEIWDNILVIKIDSFDNSLVNRDIKLIKENLKNFHGNKIAFDIRENQGGSDYYWRSLVSLTTFNDFQFESKATGRGELSLEYVKEELGDECIKSNNSEFTVTNKSRFKSKKLYDFEQIYIFTSNKNYSSADSFVKFANKSGYAISIGKETKGSGGAGNSINPMLVELPESHIIFRMDALRSEIVKTTPDFINEKNDQNSFIDIINTHK